MRVIVLLADGARPDTLASALDRGDLPAMDRLRREGAMHELTSVFPSVTGPAYAPMLMGRFPGPIGLPGLRWYDRARTTCTFPDYSRSYVGYQMSALDGDLDPRAPTIFELVHDSVAALSVITRGVPKHRQLVSLDLRAKLRAVNTHFRGDVDRWLDVDCDVGHALIEHVADDAARYVFAAFPGVDKSSHSDGHESPRVMEALRVLDETVATVRAGLEARGEWESTWLWITSDHGHSPVHEHEDLAQVVADAGFRVIAHPWIVRPRATAAVMVSGNAMAHVHVALDRRDRPFRAGLGEDGERLAALLLERPSVDVMLVPVDEQRCAVLARGGEAMVIRRDDRYSYERKEGDPLGIGEDLDGLDLTDAHEATLRTDYPDSLVQIAAMTASERAGDIILSASRGWDFRARYEPIPHRSSHGALHRDHMLVPFITNRAFPRAPRRTTDLFPTALAALGQRVPAGLDGVSVL